MSTQGNGATDDTMWASVLHAGILGTFLKVPYVEANAELLRERGARAAVYGIPWDSTSISRSRALDRCSS